MEYLTYTDNNGKRHLNKLVVYFLGAVIVIGSIAIILQLT